MRKGFGILICLLSTAGLWMFTPVAYCVPLPTEIRLNFSGTFSWESDFTSGERQIFGTAKFTLLEYQIDPNYDYLNFVNWGITLESNDAGLLYEGSFNNHETYFGGAVFEGEISEITGVQSDATSLPWSFAYWDCAQNKFTDNISGINWYEDVQTIFWEHLKPPAWNLIDNSYFLPSQLDISLIGDLAQGNIRFDLPNSAVTPVPEPGTVLLLSCGLFTVFLVARHNKPANLNC